MMWVDHSPTSPFRDRIYVIWHNGRPAFVNHRDGPGGAWQTPIQVSGPETVGTGIGSDIKTNSAGWDSGRLDPGDVSAPVTFDTVGNVPYRCNRHPADMKGTVQVVAG